MRRTIRSRSSSAGGGATDQARLAGLIYLSIAAAVATICLKGAAWLVTGSVGLLSDAAESVVNLVAALFALFVLRWSARPADDEHAYGHEKADYLAAAVEGALILVAAVAIAYTAVGRLLEPRALNEVGAGLAITVAASLINLVVARLLITEGSRQRSLVLEADGRHLMTDVWTSVGVVVGVTAAWATGWDRIDPIVALLVAGNIVLTGIALFRRFTGGVLDRALVPEERLAVSRVLEQFIGDEVRFHALRTRRAGRRAFVSVHLLVPGDWPVQHGHDLVERVEKEVGAALPRTTVFTHLEPIEDPTSYSDTELDREPAEADSTRIGDNLRLDR